MKLGLPKLRKSLAGRHLKSMSREELRECYQVPNAEFDEIEHYCASLPKPPPEGDRA